MGFLFAFGVVNLGLGLALFASGVRLIPAAFAALLGTFEPILGPIWVWLVHGEVPSARTVIGGGVVFVALLVHIGLEFRRQAMPGTAGHAPACRRRTERIVMTSRAAAPAPKARILHACRRLAKTNNTPSDS